MTMIKVAKQLAILQFLVSVIEHIKTIDTAMEDKYGIYSTTLVFLSLSLSKSMLTKQHLINVSTE